MKNYLLFSLLYFSFFYSNAQDCVPWNNIQKDTSIVFKDGICISLTNINDSLKYKGKGYKLNSQKVAFKYLDDDKIQIIINDAVPIEAKWIEEAISLNYGDKKLTIILAKNNPKTPTALNDIDTKVLKEINVYYDAISITNEQNIKAILEKYDTSDNLFLKDLLIKKGLQSQIGNSKTSSGLLGSVGNFEITSLADGLAQFIVSRVKKELSIAFFQDFKKTITDNKYRDLQILFKNNYEHLKLIDDKIYDFQPYLTTIKSNAQLDIKMIPYNLNSVLEDNNTKLHQYVDTIPNLKYTLGISFKLLSNLQNQKNFGVALEQLNTDFTENSTKIFNEDLKKGIELLRLISFALRDNKSTDSSYYLPADKIAKLSKDTVLLNNFIGLALAATKSKDSAVKFDTSLLFSILNKQDIKDNLASLNKVFSSFSEASKQLSMAQKSKDAEKIDLYFTGIAKFLETSKVLNHAIGISKTDTLFSILIKSNSLLKNIYSKNYSTAVLQIIDIFNIPSEKDTKYTIQKLYKYGTFLAQISQIDTAEEVQKVLEQYSAPVGSYRDKSIHNFSVALDSYVGVGYGKTETSTFIISTPIGLSASLGFRLCKSRASLTLMPTILDIGPLVSYRFVNNDGEVAKIYLKDIIAPGIFASLGFSSRIPLFLNVGWQKPASLTKVGASENTYNLKPYHLFSTSLAVNIPLISVFTK